MSSPKASLVAACFLILLVGCNGDSVVGNNKPTDAGNGMDITINCPTPSVACGGRCINTASDRENCGACGRACGAGQVCQTGACVADCAMNERLCPGGDGGAPRCVNTQTDRTNCGACGAMCGANTVCSNGACAFMCAAGTTECVQSAGSMDAGSIRTCADLQTDRNHCGMCGTVCQDGFACQEGRCRLRCPEVRVPCPAPTDVDSGTPTGELCVDTTTDPRNCGMCGAACPTGQFCVRGACQTMCGSGITNCSGICRDLRNDREGCGACDNVCSSGEVCVAGRCQVSCVMALTNCSGSCRDVQSDVMNCGACGTACAAGQVCSAGMCQVSCGPGLSNCTGSCRDLQTDRANCGACGTACADGQVCNAGTCQVSCMAGLVNCTGSCRDVQTDRANCGACGNACLAGQVCNAGTCAASCGAGLTVCNGGCTNTRFDPANCGACGTACGPYENAGASCNAGACVQTCNAGFADCNNDRADGCERNLNTDLAHCARCGNACPTRANATVNCTGGVCGFTCMANFADCDGNPNNGCEADLRVTVAHCGMCNRACTTANGVPGCVAGQCTIASCTAPFRDCDTAVANGCENDTRLTCGGCDLECRDRSVGSGGASFDGAGQRGVALDPGRGGLIVSGMSTTTNLDFLWVVNTAESTVGKWDATGQREVARYRVGLSTGECRGLCCYNNGCNMPSRVVVDGNADAYVASRAFGTQGSVTKVAAERANCVDRNGNGMIDTSSGPTDVRPYGQDECVLWTANVGPIDAVLRSITTDRGDTQHPFGYVWVGGFNSRQAYRLNPATGALLNTYSLSVAPYAMVVAGNGTLWATTLDGAAMQSINTNTLTVGPTVPYPTAMRLNGTCRNGYGSTVDGRGRVWIAGWDCRDAIGYDPAMNAWTRVDTTSLVGGTAGRGITVDATGRVWMAYATTGDSTSGGLLNWDSNAFVANGQMPASTVSRATLPGSFTGPSGIGVDRVGNVWLAHYQAPSPLIRYTPTTNSSVVLFGPNQVYSYSDFTGSVRRVSIAQGTYEETIDMGCDNPVLTTFRWTATTPTGTSISFAGRTAATVAGLASATAVTMALAPRDTSPTNIATAFTAASVTPARQFRVTVSMQASEGGATPVLQSFNVGWRCMR